MNLKTPKKVSIWSYYLASVLAVLLSLTVITWYSIDRYRDFFTDQLKLTLEDRASMIAAKIVTSLEQTPGGNIVIDQTTCQIQTAHKVRVVLYWPRQRHLLKRNQAIT